MLSLAVILAVVAIALAWPVPLLLHRQRRSSKDPLADLILWQSIGLAGGLSLVGTVIAVALSPLGDSIPRAVVGLVDVAAGTARPPDFTLWHAGALVIGLVIVAVLFYSLAVAAIKAHRRSKRHRELLSLLTRPSSDDPDTRVLETDAPVAYCLPSGGSPTTVVSSGLLQLLSGPERRAVIAHEAAHLRARHSLLMLPFLAWRSALPGTYAPQVALGSVAELIELMADDSARRSVRAADLESALKKTAIQEYDQVPPNTDARLARLRNPLPAINPVRRTATIAAAVALFLVPTIAVLLWGAG